MLILPAKFLFTYLLLFRAMHVEKVSSSVSASTMSKPDMFQLDSMTNESVQIIKSGSFGLISILILALITGLLSRSAVIRYIYKVAQKRPINTNILIDYVSLRLIFSVLLNTYLTFFNLIRLFKSSLLARLVPY